MLNRLSLILFFSFLFKCGSLSAQAQPNRNVESDKGSNVQFPKADQFANSKLSYNIISAANNTFCYDILADGRIMIHQPSVPGLPGNDGFKTKTDAIKVAKMVIEKIKNGEMPPSVASEEMKKLGVL